MEQAKPNNEKTKLVKERKLEDLPVEVLVKIFNYLPNHDVRCGVALACKEFQKICQDESLVPVKDLSIKGHYYKYRPESHEQFYGLRNIGGIFVIIFNSKYLTTLKITALKYDSIYNLTSTALQVCPKLKHLEIVDTFAQPHLLDEAKGVFYPDLTKIFQSILTFGNGLHVINLKIYNGCIEEYDGQKDGYCFDWVFDDYISKGCPKLKSLSLESLDLDGDSNMFIEICESAGLRSLSKGCKELENLKLTKICLGDANSQKWRNREIKEMFPNCNVELKNCVKPKTPWSKYGSQAIPY